MEDNPNLSGTKFGTATSGPPINRLPRSDDHAALRTCPHKTCSRNLIVCIDGTSNQFGKKNTNVIELYNLILKEVSDNQRTWYNSGIGTYARPSWRSWKFYKQVLVHKIDLAIAWDFERTIMGAYRWLSDNYEQGDCIFLFGFSRGAFQVRALSAMIDKVGLIFKGNEMQIPFAYELYADPSSNQVTTLAQEVGSQREIPMAERFKRAFSHKDVQVHFVGAWDTVSSIGITRSKDMLPGTIDGMIHVCYFRHALALDERRVKFLPEYAFGGAASKAQDTLSVKSVAPPWGSSMTLSDLVLSLVVNALIMRLIVFGIFKVTKSLKRPGGVLQEAKATSEEVLTTDNLKNVSTLSSESQHKDNTLPNGLSTLSNKSVASYWSSSMTLFGLILSLIMNALVMGLIVFSIFKVLREVEATSEDKNVSTKDNIPLTYKTVVNKTLPSGQNVDMTNHSNMSMREHPHTLEVWFAGTHSDIGGGNIENIGMDRSRPPLRWMVIEAGTLGLRMAPFDRALSSAEQIEIKESLSWWWWALEVFPFKRLTYTLKKDGKPTTYRPHLGSCRKIHPGQKIHSSLLLTDRTNYIPKACPVDDDISFWKRLRGEGLREWLELDMYEYTQNAMKDLIIPDYRDNAFGVLSQIAMSRYGRQAVYESLIEALAGDLESEIKHRLLHSVMDILKKGSQDDSQLELGSLLKIRPLVSDLWKSSNEDYQEIAQEFLVRFTERRLVFNMDTCILPVVFSPDSRYMASNSADGMVFILDRETEKVVRAPFHKGRVISVAFSPKGECVVCSSEDNTFWIWDADRGKLVGEPFQGHTDHVLSVAFSHDGRRLVSTSLDRTVQIWNAETGKPVGEPFQGHINYAISVAFSSDNRHIVSGLSDGKVQIWDAETGKPLGEPFQGHTDIVEYVAFSPDGSHVASRSNDNTVQIWDVETGKEVEEPFQGWEEDDRDE